MPFPTLLLLLTAVSLTAFAQIAFKVGVTKKAPISEEATFIDALLPFILSPYIWLGLMTYGVSTVLWLWVLSKIDLSLAYPFVGLSFVLTMILASVLLDENLSVLRIGGTFLIVIGCVLVSKSA